MAIAAAAIAVAIVSSSLLYLALLAQQGQPPRATTPIEQVVIIMKENHAFDNYFGTFPGADGLSGNESIPDGHGGFVQPHWLNATSTPDLPHDRDSMIRAFNDGRNDGFAIVAEAWGPGRGNDSMGYFDGRQLPGYWDLASRYVLADRYFQSMLGPTIPNRIYSLAGTAGGLISNALPSEGFGFPTILDQLTDVGIPWAYYHEPIPEFPPLPMYFRTLRSDPMITSKLVSLDRLLDDIRVGALPSVAYVDPLGPAGFSEHPPENISRGEAWTMSFVDEIVRGPQWNSTAVFVTWDESGGYYDHVPPPQVDEWGYGFRVPLLIISPYAKKGWIDSEVMDHTSILKFIARNWSLPPLTEREVLAHDMFSAFEFESRGPGYILELGSEGSLRHPSGFWLEATGPLMVRWSDGSSPRSREV